MGNDLRLQVLLNAIDRVTAPLRSIQRQSTVAAQALKAARDRLKGLNDSQKQINGFRELKQGLTSTRTELLAAQESTKALGRALSQTQNPTRALQRDFEHARTALQRLKDQESAQTRQLQTLRQSLQTAGIETRNLGEHERRLQQQMLNANSQIDAQRRRLEALTKQQQQLTRASKAYQQGQQQVGNIAGKGAAGMAIGGTALYAGARMFAPGVEFDASMSKTQAITRLGKDSEELKALRDQARELGGSTMFTAGQAADAQGFLGMAGFDPKSIKDAMPGMLDLAAAGGTELAQTADIASNIMSGLGLKTDQMGRLGDVLVGTFTRSNTNLQMLGETMKYAAPMAKTYGISLETAAAMAGKLGDAGLQGSMGGTVLSTVMNRLAAPPKMAADALEKLNIKTADANGNLRELPDILKEIHDKTAGMGTAVKGGVFKAIAGAEAVKGMAHLVDQAGSSELQKFIATLQQTQGESNKTAKVMAENLKGDITTLKSAWADLGIEVEEQQDGALRALVKRITRVIGSIKTWTRENPVLAGALVKVAAGIAIAAAVLGTLALTLATILGPMVLLRFLLAQLGIRFPGITGLIKILGQTLMGSLIPAIRAAGVALWGLATNPAALAIAAAIAAIAVTALVIYKYWEPIKAWMIGLFTGIKDGLKPIRDAFSAAFSPIAPLIARLWTLIKPLVAWFGELLSPVQASGDELGRATWSGIEFGRGVGAVLTGLLTPLRVLLEFIAQIPKAFDGGLSGIAALILNFSPLGLFYRAFAGVMSYFGVELPGKFTEFGSMIIDGLIGGIKEKFGSLKEAFSSIGDSSIGWFKEKMGIHSPSRVFAELGGFTMEGLTQGLEGGQKGPLSALTSLGKQLTAAGTLALSATAMPALAVDERPPIRSSNSSIVYDSHDTYEINFPASPGMDLKSMEKSLRTMLSRIENEKKARQRSKLSDLE